MARDCAIGTASDDNIMPHGLTSSFQQAPGDVVMNATSGTKTATFDLNGSTQTINGLISTAASPGSNTVFSSLPNRVLILGDSNVTATFAGNIQDGSTTGASLGITKIGSGMQTFSGNLNYTGPTVVTGGTLAPSAPARTSTAANSSTCNPAQPSTSARLAPSPSAQNQILGGRGTVVGNVSMSDPNAKLAPGQVGVVGTLTVNGTVFLVVALSCGSEHPRHTGRKRSAPSQRQPHARRNHQRSSRARASGLANGSYPLIRYTGTLTNGGNFALTPSTRPNLSVSFTGGAVNLIVGGSPSLSLTWSGNNGNNNWEPGHSPNFNSGDQQFFNWDSVTFSDSGNNASDVNVSAESSAYRGHAHKYDRESIHLQRRRKSHQYDPQQNRQRRRHANIGGANRLSLTARSIRNPPPQPAARPRGRPSSSGSPARGSRSPGSRTCAA